MLQAALPPWPPAGGRRAGQIADDSSVDVDDDGADRHGDGQVFAALPAICRPMPFSPRCALKMRSWRKSTSVLRFSSATSQTLPPAPPSPPSGPPSGMNFSTETDAAVAAVAGEHFDFCFVYEFHADACAMCRRSVEAASRCRGLAWPAASTKSPAGRGFPQRNRYPRIGLR
jgi:hypothetical protein